MIVVMGDPTITPGFSWNGIVLVGRRLTVTGTAPVVRGAIVSGLDFKLGGSFDESRSGQTASDQIDLRYDSCHIAAALARYGHLVAHRQRLDRQLAGELRTCHSLKRKRASMRGSRSSRRATSTPSRT